ncbi:MAG: hypothetical protein JRH20_22430 [Deltaproteobacteria bacterium]|nr:hypothetical protein [Deltaproteobacteria bacterium]
MIEKRLITDEERKRLLDVAGDEDEPSQVTNLLQQICQLTELISNLEGVKQKES